MNKYNFYTLEELQKEIDLNLSLIDRSVFNGERIGTHRIEPKNFKLLEEVNFLGEAVNEIIRLKNKIKLGNGIESVDIRFEKNSDEIYIKIS